MINLRTLSGTTAKDLRGITEYPREVPQDAPALDNYIRHDRSAGEREAPSLWAGQLADEFNLQGEVKQSDQIAALKGFNPRTGQPILATSGDARRYGWEIVLSADLDVSALAGVADKGLHDAIAKAHDTAVRAALSEAERRWIHARRGAGGAVHEQAKLLFSAYRHEASRPPSRDPNARPDPQLHSHIFLHNLALRSDGTWSTIDPRSMFQHQRTIDAIYKCELAHQLHQLGFQIGRTDGNQLHISGVPEATHEQFGRRRKQILEAMRNPLAQGREAARARESARQNTRADKPAIQASELRANWRERAAQAGLTPDLIESLRARGRGAVKPTLEQWRETVREALFEHESVANERQIWETVSQRAIGYLPAERIADEVEHLKANLLHLEDRDHRRETWTTRELYKQETGIIESAMRRLDERSQTLKRETINEAFERFERERGFVSNII